MNPVYEDQQKTIKEVLNLVIEAIRSFILEGIGSAMSNFNSLTVGKKEIEG